jgi:F0F1-type ATP synthase beta subunit
MIFGQMKEPPGARFLVGLAALSVAEYFDSALVLSRDIAAEGLYPAVDPLASSSIEAEGQGRSVRRQNVPGLAWALPSQ